MVKNWLKNSWRASLLTLDLDLFCIMSQIHNFKVGIHTFAWAYRDTYESVLISYFQLYHFKILEKDIYKIFSHLKSHLNIKLLESLYEGYAKYVLFADM